MPGPDFPTGGVHRRAARADPGGLQDRAAAASACARKWEKEDTGRGTYQIVVTEIPYQVQKAKLVERIAELINEKKLPLLGDVRDEVGRDRAPGARAQEPRRRSRAC